MVAIIHHPYPLSILGQALFCRLPPSLTGAATPMVYRCRFVRGHVLLVAYAPRSGPLLRRDALASRWWQPGGYVIRIVVPTRRDVTRRLRATLHYATKSGTAIAAVGC